MEFRGFVHRVVAREDLSVNDAREAVLMMLEGAASAVLVSAFLVGLRMKGETVDELVGFAQAMREKAVRVDGGPANQLVDTCGTGGDQAGTFNISTTAAFVVAGAGVRVAKHGNRSISSRCGSADVLEALGVRVDLDGEQAGRAIREVGIGFLFSQRMHPGMQFVQSARSELKTRTVFNLLGPLTNPAGAAAQLIGAPSAQAAKLMAQALSRLGPTRALVVHGSDGLDEITTTAPTLVYQVVDGQVDEYTWTPSDFGIPQAELSDLAGGDKALNGEIAKRILTGAPGPPREVVLINAAAALLIAGSAANPADAMQRAALSVDSGAALSKVHQLVSLTRASSYSTQRPAR